MPKYKKTKVRGRELDIITIIPARGGSERLYRKNLRPFAGKSLLEWGIIQAQTCQYIGDVYVITESDEVAERAREYEAYVLREPAAYSGQPGGAGTALNVARYLIANERNIDLEYNHLLTEPFIKPGDIDHLFERHWQGSIKITHFACKIEDIYVAKEIATNIIETCLKDFNGNYFFTNMGCVIDPAIQLGIMPYLYGHTYYELEFWQNMTIDTQEDLEIAEIIFEKKILKGNPNVYQDYAKSNPPPLHDSWKYDDMVGVEDE